jgi:hypothetical protein
VPKPEVKEEDDEEAAKMAEYLHRYRLNSDDPGDCLGLNAAFMASLNDSDSWREKIDEAITMSIRDAGMPLVNLIHGDEAGPSDTSGAVKDEPVNERGKQDVVDDIMYNFHQYYEPSGRCKYY